MGMSDFERSVSIVLTDRHGAEMRVSAVFYQDAHYLHHNRIALIGTRDQEMELLWLDTEWEINWALHARSDWNLSGNGNYKKNRNRQRLGSLERDDARAGNRRGLDPTLRRPSDS